MDKLLEMRNITKQFGGVKALDNVSLDIDKGEIHALVGANGAGKSTLMKTLLGIITPDTADICYRGEKVLFNNPREALSHGISMIHQETQLIQEMTVAENIWLGREDQFMVGIAIDKGKRLKKTKELLENINFDINPSAQIKNLSIAQMQLVELARAISNNSELIIMDEPTACLSMFEIEVLFKVVRDLKEQGIAIIFISHKLDEVLSICDGISVLRDGKNVGECKASETTKDDLIRMMTGREIQTTIKDERNISDEEILRVEGFSDGNLYKNINFNVKKGEIVGFFGLVGAGRTEIMRGLFGIDPHSSGRVIFEGKEIQIKTPSDAVKNGMCMVTEDRLRLGGIFTMSVMMNSTLMSVDKFCSKSSVLNRIKEKELFSQITKRLLIKHGSPNDLIGSLSGGNQQKVILARCLLADPKLIILDEPTHGIDVGAKSEIYALINQLADEGISVILISSEIEEIMALSDRIYIVKNGQITNEYDQKDATQENLLTYAFK